MEAERRTNGWTNGEWRRGESKRKSRSVNGEGVVTRRGPGGTSKSGWQPWSWPRDVRCADTRYRTNNRSNNSPRTGRKRRTSGVHRIGSAGVERCRCSRIWPRRPSTRRWYSRNATGYRWFGDCTVGASGVDDSGEELVERANFSGLELSS